MPGETEKKSTLKSGFTFVFVPHSTEKPRSIHIAGSRLKTAKLIGSVLICITAILGAHYISLIADNLALKAQQEEIIMENQALCEKNQEKEERIKALQAANENKSEQIDAFVESADELEEQLEKLLEREETIIEKAEIDASSLPEVDLLNSDEPLFQKLSTGDPLKDAADGIISEQGRTARETATSIRQLSAALPSQMTRMDEIETQIEERKAAERKKQQHTPSIWPVSGRITSGFGPRSSLGRAQFHSGVDIGASHGTPIRAAANGRVEYQGYRGGYGNLLIINHGYSYKTYYAHLSGFNVSHGQTVSKGDVIGYVGVTGRSTGPHLHYEVHVNGTPVNPRGYMH